MHADGIIHGPGGEDHATRDKIAGHGDAGECDGRMLAVAVDDILVSGDVHGGNDNTESKTGAQARPDGDRRVIRPTEPEQDDGQQGRRCDGGPES